MQKREAIKHCAAFALIVIILSAITLSLATFFSLNNKVSTTAAQNIRTVVIDAGHGGMDGGAVAPDGTAEKDINLNIAHKLALLMRVSGYNVVMTRNEDVMLDTGVLVIILMFRAITAILSKVMMEMSVFATFMLMICMVS